MDDLVIILLVYMTYHTSAFILNVNLATFSHVSQMPGMTLIVLKEICSFKVFKFYNSNKVHLGNVFFIDTRELNLQNVVDPQEISRFCPNQGIFIAEGQ